MSVALSINGIPISLSPERWAHVVGSHDDLEGCYEDALRAIESPESLLDGYRGSLIAAREVEAGRFLAVIYREVSGEEGTVLTACFTSSLERRKAGWMTP